MMPDFSNLSRSTCFPAVTWPVFATCFFLAGCFQPAPLPPEDSSPVTTQKLTGARLTDIREPLSWKFNDTTVVIENDGKPIPPDLVKELLGEESKPMKIEATWSLDEGKRVLNLKLSKSDQKPLEKTIALPINPAGNVRINLGGRQYNLFRDSPQKP